MIALIRSDMATEQIGLFGLDLPTIGLLLAKFFVAGRRA